MIPLRNNLRTKRPAGVNRAIIMINVGVFIFELINGHASVLLIQTFGFIPARLFHPDLFAYSGLEAVMTLGTSLFLHGGFVHLLGNMIYLWVFGDEVEQRIGGVAYGFFFVCAGAIGSIAHAAAFPGSTVPSIGASGSIAGVLGAFLVLFPRARVVTLFPLVISWALAEIPALVFLPLWFGLQFLNGYFALHAASGVEQVVNVAWWAHIGGFLFGATIALLTRRRDAHQIAETAGATGRSHSGTGLD
ncbi:MAG: rhomboid family intramembrane serine protease [Thermoanaerobaculia bacterium]